MSIIGINGGSIPKCNNNTANMGKEQKSFFLFFIIIPLFFTDFQCTKDETRRQQLSIVYLIILSGAMTLLFLAFVFIIHVKLYKKKKFMSSLPRKKLPLTRDDVPIKIYRLIVDQVAKVDSPNIKLLPKVLADKGWGVPGTSLEHTHFKTSIACSFSLLVKVINMEE